MEEKKPKLHRRKRQASEPLGKRILKSKLVPISLLLVGIGIVGFGLFLEHDWSVLVILTGGAIIVFGIVTMVLYVRQVILNNEQFHEHICPRCKEEHVLKRTKRRYSDRFFGWLFGLPIRRHICGECGWVGIRIHRYKLR